MIGKMVQHAVMRTLVRCLYGLQQLFLLDDYINRILS